MTEVLNRFVQGCEPYIRDMVSDDMKDRRVMAILESEGIEIPQDVLYEIESLYAGNDSHESVMDSMRPYL